jgi:hypothetical protein
MKAAKKRDTVGDSTAEAAEDRRGMEPPINADKRRWVN